jgi:hypothetical protein
MKQFRKQLKLVSEASMLHSVVHRPPPFPFHALSLDVQARPYCCDGRIPGYDHHDLHLSICDP